MKNQKETVEETRPSIIQTSNSKLIHGDAVASMKKLPDRSIDLICTDLPYGVTRNHWDTIIPLVPMWQEFERVIKDNGAIVLTATQPFTSMLIMSNLELFKYDLVWEKTISSGQLNVKHQPMRSHESVLVFYKQKPTYNEQLTEGKPYSIKRKINYGDNNYNKQKDSEKINSGYRHAKSVLKISNPRIKGGHPTQKPLELMDWIIKTYSNEKETVLDCCMGGGTTGVSALSLNRAFVGIELDDIYFDKTVERIREYEENRKSK